MFLSPATTGGRAGGARPVTCFALLLVALAAAGGATRISPPCSGAQVSRQGEHSLARAPGAEATDGRKAPPRTGSRSLLSSRRKPPMSASRPGRFRRLKRTALGLAVAVLALALLAGLALSVRCFKIRISNHDFD